MKTALVLSAGGMFGAYEVGAWRVLAQTLQPDIVIGASVGALNGWVIAGGCPPEELGRNWLDRDWAGVVRKRKAFFDPAPLAARCQELTSGYQPRVPFGAALVEVPRLRRVLVRTPQIDWRHLLATCSIPGGFPPVRIDGRFFVDGGLLGALPLWAAGEMGATQAVVIDVLPSMPSWWVRAVVRTARCFAARQRFPLVPVAGRVAPARPLGSLADMLYWDAGNIQRWMAQGERDAREFRLSPA